MVLWQCGRGFGKTRIGAEEIWAAAAQNPGHRYLVAAPTSGDLRDVCFEGESGIIACCPPELIRKYNRSTSEAFFWNGAYVKGITAEKPNRFRGPQWHGGWADEVAAWEKPEAFKNLMPSIRLGRKTNHKPWLLCTTTPKPNILAITEIYKLASAGRAAVVRGGMMENLENLATEFVDVVLKLYEGTRLGRQEIDGELLQDVPGALWQRAWFDQSRISVTMGIDQLAQVVIAIDPAVTANPGSDETGIAVCARGHDERGYVLQDVSMKASPNTWAKAAVMAFDRWRADAIIGEVNNGGDLVEAAIRTAARDLFNSNLRRSPEVSYRAVRASRGKAVRAQPVAQLYEQGRVSHVGTFDVIEDQMCNMTPDFDSGKAGYSPDRLEAVVWGFTALFIEAEYIPLVGPAGDRREREPSGMR